MKKSVSSGLLTTLIVVAALLIPTAILTAKDKSEKANVKVEISVPSFTAIHAQQGIQVNFTQGPATGKVVGTTTATGAKYLKATVDKKGVLNLRYDIPWGLSKSNETNITGPTVVNVSAPVLREVELTSAASFNAPAGLTDSKEIEFELTSAGSANISSIQAPSVEFELTSAASINVQSVKGNLSLEATSAATANIDKVVGTKCDIEVTSAAQATVKAVKAQKCEAEATSGAKINIAGMDCVMVEASATSGASVTLSGKCTNFTQQTSSGGSVNSANLHH